MGGGGVGGLVRWFVGFLSGFVGWFVGGLVGGGGRRGKRGLHLRVTRKWRRLKWMIEKEGERMFGRSVLEDG